MKHYYIKRDNKTLYSAPTERPRQGYYYVGEFEDTPSAMAEVFVRLRGVMNENNRIRYSLGLNKCYDINEFKDASCKELCWALIGNLEVSMDLQSQL